MALSSRQRAEAGRVIRAAGAVLWRPGPSGPQLGLIHRPRYDDWSFPKGKVDPGEHVQLAALREVREETGLRAALGRRLPSIEYESFGQPKHVRYWAGRALPEPGGGRFVPNNEVDRLAWFSPEEARRRLTRPLDVTVLDAFMAEPADTVPIVLLRHGAAEPRSAAYPDDRLRPLAPAGRTRIAVLPALLDCFGPLRAISSPSVRCVETLRPFAVASGMDGPDLDAALSEAAHEADPRAIGGWLRSLIAQGRPTVVCTHRPLLDSMIEAVVPSPGDPHGPWVRGRPWSRHRAERLLTGQLDPGSAWVLQVARGTGPQCPPRLVAVDRLKPKV